MKTIVVVGGGSAVKDYDNGKVILANGEGIETHSLIWASEVIAREVPGLPKDDIGLGKRLAVDKYNRVQGTILSTIKL